MNSELIKFEDNRPYDPLHDDAQAMALVKKFGLAIAKINDKSWGVQAKNLLYVERDNLNQAICECVAKMQQAKP